MATDKFTVESLVKRRFEVEATDNINAEVQAFLMMKAADRANIQEVRSCDVRDDIEEELWETVDMEWFREHLPDNLIV